MSAHPHTGTETDKVPRPDLGTFTPEGLRGLCTAYADHADHLKNLIELLRVQRDAAIEVAEALLKDLERAHGRLEFLNDNPDMVFHLGNTWYYREGYCRTHRKAKDLIDAIDKIIGAKNAT